MQVGYYLEGNGLLMMGGDAYGKQAVAVEQQLESSLESSLTLLAATDGASIFGFIEKLFEDLFKYGIGGLYEMTCINSVYNPVTAESSGGTFPSANAQKMADQADEAFRTLFIALDSASAVGFSQLDLAKGKGDGLRFELTDTPAKPTINGPGGANKAAQNGIHLVTPSIGTGGQQHLEVNRNRRGRPRGRFRGPRGRSRPAPRRARTRSTPPRAATRPERVSRSPWPARGQPAAAPPSLLSTRARVPQRHRRSTWPIPPRSRFAATALPPV
jgi:hypothetical protein